MSTTIRAIVAVALIALATAVQAQTAGIRGVVVDDANEEPLIGASIYIEQLRQGVTANSPSRDLQQTRILPSYRIWAIVHGRRRLHCARARYDR